MDRVEPDIQMVWVPSPATIVKLASGWDGRDARGRPMLLNVARPQVPALSAGVWFVDLIPDANWAHPCCYIVVDRDDTDERANRWRVTPIVWDMPPSESWYGA